VKQTYFVSGGKDSTAMLVKALELGWPVDEAVFLDTTLEFPELYTYLDKVDSYIADYDIQIERRVTSTKSFEDGFYRKITKGPREGKIQGFPFAAFKNFCWIRRDFKKFPTPGENDCHSIGIAADEAQRTGRSMYAASKEEQDAGCTGCAPFGDQCNGFQDAQRSRHFRFPLIEWNMSEADCVTFLRERDLLNPLYDRFKRIGCWLCVYQSKNSLHSLYTYYPDLWKKILEYEADSPHHFKPNIMLESLAHEFDKQNAQTTLV
jgi:3'-phosphoadenosine 5'-phosphosulfate sulfotransferase (PAPS reductase)/FAD synthetase